MRNGLTVPGRKGKISEEYIESCVTLNITKIKHIVELSAQ